jgi:hypothetical protein
LSTIQIATETLIRLLRRDVDPDTVLVASDDPFEITRTPSVVLQGPRITEDTLRRTPSKYVEADVSNLTFEECRAPRLYHLDYEVIVTTATQRELLSFQERVARFLMMNPIVEIPDQGFLNLTELTPLGGLARVNLSNLRQSAGKLRIEDCPVYDEVVSIGKLIVNRTIEMCGAVDESITQ